MAINFKEEYLAQYNDKSRKLFIERNLSTFNADERKEVPFILFPRQLVLLDSISNFNNTVAIKHRQAGITTVVSGWVTAQCVFASKKKPETVLCIGNNMDTSQQLLEKVAFFLDQVPRWMWGGDFYSPDPNSLKNKKSIYKVRNKKQIELVNGCKLYARSSGANAARGISAVSILIFDEAAFIKDGMTVYTQAVAATASVSNAKIIMISTPHGKDQLYYRTYIKALRKENNYNSVKFAWYQDPRYNRFLTWSKMNEETEKVEVIKDPVINAKGDIEYNEERWEKLSKDGWEATSPWFEEACKTFNNDPQKIAQELCVSFLGSSDNVIQPEVIEYQINNNVKILEDDWPLKDQLIPETWIWKDPIPGHRYICGIDNSSGAASDKTAIEIIDVDAIDENGLPYYEQVLEYNGKLTGDEVGELAYSYATSYNNALIVVECIGGYGDATILALQRMKYKNLYYEQPQLKTYTIQRAYSNFDTDLNEKLPGFRSNSLRMQLIQNFTEMVRNNSFRIRSIRVISEMETWIWKNGKPNHMDGCHDDTLMCLSMTLFVMMFYMIKSEKDKEKDAAIVSSWRINNSYTVNTKENEESTSNIFNPKNTPFYGSKQIERDKQRRLNAMLMLGGFRNR